MPKTHQGRQDTQPHILAGQPHGPAVTITRRAADRLRAGHLWVYRSDTTALIPREGEEAIAPGALVTVADNRNIPLGTGLYSSASETIVRAVASEPVLTRKVFLAQTRDRINAALDLRDALSPENANNNAARLIFSEADALPGIVVDRYNDLVILQLLTQGTA